MIMPCEISAKSIVPATRALLAVELAKNYGLNQNEVANLLGVTQSAVSKYVRHIRGSVLTVGDLEEVKFVVKEMATSLINGDYSTSELMMAFCRICRIVRRSGSMCGLCRRADPKIGIEDCSFCLVAPSPNPRARE